MFKNDRLQLLLIFLWSLTGINTIFGQLESDEGPLLDIDYGLGYEIDGKFKINMRFRMQNRFGFRTIHGSLAEIDHFDARVRRLRLRLDGYLINRKLAYYIQLSFSRWDQDLERSPVPQTVRDAMIYYVHDKNLYFGFGQGKLPGNRQRVISSGNLQFADRSIANFTYNIDRDVGFFGYYTQEMGPVVLNWKAAITLGEGRNAVPTNNGLCYTGRLEFLPFGLFEPNSDYLEGDFLYTEDMKLSLAWTTCWNNKAILSGGQLGFEMPLPQNILTHMGDFIFKYRGLAVMGEYFYRRLDYTLFNDPNQQRLVSIYAGTGYNFQWSYCFKNKYEPAIRLAGIIPEQSLKDIEHKRNELWLGYTKYLKGHRIKAQANLIYNWFDNHFKPDRSKNNFWNFLFQVELGI